MRAGEGAVWHGNVAAFLASALPFSCLLQVFTNIFISQSVYLLICQSIPLYIYDLAYLFIFSFIHPDLEWSNRFSAFKWDCLQSLESQQAA